MWLYHVTVRRTVGASEAGIENSNKRFPTKNIWIELCQGLVEDFKVYLVCIIRGGAALNPLDRINITFGHIFHNIV